MTNRITGTLWGRRLLAGLLSWLIPFLVSVPFYGRDGTLLIDQMLFKSLMIVVGSITAAVLMVWFFSIVTAAYAREAMITGGIWLMMNWILDIAVLIGLLDMTPWEYGAGIGLRYLVIPAMVIPAGIIADHAVKRSRN
jgi:hypothetical protein